MKKNKKSGSYFGLPMMSRDKDPFADEEARRRRVVQAAALMELFRRANGREASTADELRRWVAVNEPRDGVDPSSILTPEQIASALHDCLRRR